MVFSELQMLTYSRGTPFELNHFMERESEALTHPVRGMIFKNIMINALVHCVSEEL